MAAAQMAVGEAMSRNDSMVYGSCISVNIIESSLWLFHGHCTRFFVGYTAFYVLPGLNVFHRTGNM